MDTSVVKDAIAEISHTDTEIGDDTRLLQDLGLKSIQLVELAVALEDKLGRPVADSTVMKARTVADLVHALEAA